MTDRVASPVRSEDAAPVVYSEAVRSSPTGEGQHRRPARRARRIAGTSLIVIGGLVLVWAFVVWRWNDPLSAAFTAWEQRGLERELATVVQEEQRLIRRSSPVARITPEEISARAKRFAARASDGDPIGRIEIPRLGVEMVVLNGTSTGTLRRGPGRHLRTALPGQGRLVYIAGHRTTYGAPFAHIDRLRPGDRVLVAMPYGTFEYAVTRQRIVDDEDLSVLKSGTKEELALQACHPRFRATQRLIVYAKPIRIVSGGATVRMAVGAKAGTS